MAKVMIFVDGSWLYVSLPRLAESYGKPEWSCAREYADPLDKARVKDTDIIWLDDLAAEVELRYERQKRECQSPLHKGDRWVWTTFRPRKGKPFYCDDCRRLFAEQRRAAEAEFVGGPAHLLGTEPETTSAEHTGRVEKMFPDRGFGFIRAADGKQYFFHMSELEDMIWPHVTVGQEVTFVIKKQPLEDKAGAAGNVRRL